MPGRSPECALCGCYCHSSAAVEVFRVLEPVDEAEKLGLLHLLPLCIAGAAVGAVVVTELVTDVGDAQAISSGSGAV